MSLDYKALYDSLALNTLSRGLDDAWKNMEYSDAPRAEAVGKLIRAMRPKSILEVAAGYGFVTHYIVKFNPKVPVTCLEIAAPFCDVLRANGREVIEDDFITATLNRTWDVVTIMQVLEHLESWDVLKSVLKKIASWAERFVIVEI